MDLEKGSMSLDLEKELGLCGPREVKSMMMEQVANRLMEFTHLLWCKERTRETTLECTSGIQMLDLL